MSGRTFKIQHRTAGLQRYRVVTRSGSDIFGASHYKFWTLRGARRWVAACKWADVDGAS